MNIGILGTGLMGVPMAVRSQQSGHAVTAAIARLRGWSSLRSGCLF